MKILKEINLKIRSINRSIVAVLMLALTFGGCNEEPWKPTLPSKATLSETTISSEATTLTGTTSGDKELRWVAVVTMGGDFCSVAAQTGSVGTPFTLIFSENTTEADRTAEVQIRFTDGFDKSFTIKQLAATEYPNYDRAWGEQPHYTNGAKLVHKTYFTKDRGGKDIRNYSICYDTDKLVSLWVAYPVHNCYNGSSGRTDKWSFDDYYYYNNPNGQYIPTDPVIPQEKQQNIAAGGYQTSGLDRGHMLPSASRLLNLNTNAQTFYATNMMPQNSNFNQGVWGNLEGKVRNWGCSDTLFVVTGTIFENNVTITARGRTIRRPSHAYKLVLRTRSGYTHKSISDITSANDIKCIGFLFSNDENGANTSIKEAAMSVADIEKRCGIKFFRNLHEDIADEVKSQNKPSDWGL